MAFILKVDGTTETITDLSLKGLQNAVGGLIELVYLADGRIMYCDEEGKMKEKPLNKKATEIYNAETDFIVGDVVIMTDEEASD